MSEQIGILGCGWLGLPLGKHLVKQGYIVKGTTTSPHKLKGLESQGITPFLIQIAETTIDGDIQQFLKHLSILVLNVPPKLRNAKSANYLKKMKLLLHHIKVAKVPHLLFVSSTSVYGDVQGEIREDTLPNPTTESGKQLLQTENLYRNEENIKTTVLRFGGLIGEDRHPVFHLSGKMGLRNGEELVNLIHRNDCIHMIATIIEQHYWNEIFNGVYPYHPTKKQYYTTEAQKMGIPLPGYEAHPEKSVKKRIQSQNFSVKGHRLLTSIVA